MAIDARLAYIENEILQADPVRLIQMLYRGAIDAVERAGGHVRDGDIVARSRQITKVSEILNELTLSLDRERGGDIATNLTELYDYLQRRLQDANFRQSEEPLFEVHRILTTLLEGWDQCKAVVPAATPVLTHSAPILALSPSKWEDALSYAPRRAVDYA